MKKIYTEKNRNAFSIIREELNRLDPMELTPGEMCPIDEYDPETERIISKAYKTTDYKILAKDMQDVFTEMFAKKFDAKLFYDSAKAILNRISEI